MANSPPPPSLPHLFLFVACCGIFLASARGVDREALQSPTIFGLMVLAAYGLCVAGAWTALVLWIVRQVRGQRWPLEPGFILAVILGLRLALEVLLSIPSRPLFQSTEVVLDMATCLLLVCPLLFSLPTRWQVIIAVLLACYLPVPAILPFARPLATVLLMASGLWLDRRAGFRGSWLHILGAGLWIYYALVVLVLALLAHGAP